MSYLREKELYEHHQHELLMNAVSPIYYKGCNILKVGDKFHALGNEYDDLLGAKMAITNSFLIIQQSLSNDIDEFPSYFLNNGE